MIEALWSKRHRRGLSESGRIRPRRLGVAAAAKYHFGTTPDKLSMRQAAALASIPPAPKERRPQGGPRRSRAIAEGAATIQADGRDACLRLTY